MTDDGKPDILFTGVAEHLSAFRRFPVALYRLQLNRSFTFRDAERLVPYLHGLGITDCYASPYLKARPGSLHGYDISDHNALNPEIGSEAEYNAFGQTLQRHGMGQVLDIVPNHMGIGESGNLWWMDVLENGPSSVYAPFFDIDWTPVKRELEDKVLLPILADQYGRVLENQELTLTYEEGAFFIRYQEYKLPIAPRTSTSILKHRLGDLSKTLGSNHPHLLEFRSIITALNNLPLRNEKDPERILERHREKEIIKRRLADLYRSSHQVRLAVVETLRVFNGEKGDPRSFDLLDALLDSQAYRLAYWRVAAEEINYRRFFDVNDLAAICMENPVVFEEAHKLIFRLVREGKVTGLRIDHPDGLFDPVRYFLRLQRTRFAQICRELLAREDGLSDEEREALERQALERFDQEWAGNPAAQAVRPLYLVVEKILGRGENLPETWPVHGTTGYDFLNVLNGIFVDPAAEKMMDDIYATFIHTRVNFQDLLYEKKKLLMHVSMSSEVNVLGHYLNRLSEKNRWSRDFTLNSLTDALREIIACFPVYRIYIDETGVKERDRTYIEAAVARAKRKNPAISASIFDFVQDVLLLKYPENSSAEDRREQLTFVMRFQQCTGPVMAKGLEDTTFYIYNRLVSLNEVGGAPEKFGISVSSFHRYNMERLERWPYALSATSTHDTKRSEDVRARINVLSEIPHEWRSRLARWSRLNRRKKIIVDGQPAPDPNEEYLLYQTLLGAWPLEPVRPEEYKVFVERIQGYMLKAVKEAKVNTSWINPNTAYDQAVLDFVAIILEDSLTNRFLADFRAFQRKIAQYGIYNSLSQTLLKIASPGVPDIYQGNEIWDFSLVDPDNRRPIDYDLRLRMLKGLQKAVAGAGEDLTRLAGELTETKEDGRIKLYVTCRALTYRRAHGELFGSGAYIPLEGVGAKKEHICAFARRSGNQIVVVVVPRFLTRLTRSPEGPPVGQQIWEDTWVVFPDPESGRQYRNIFTGETIETVERQGRLGLPLGSVFACFPVALLASPD